MGCKFSVTAQILLKYKFRFGVKGVSNNTDEFQNWHFELNMYDYKYEYSLSHRNGTMKV